jgi:hypothetical protein
MLYKIIQSTDPQVVVDTVNKQIKEDWRPFGGLSISSWYPEGFTVNAITRYAQAMIKE